MKENKLYIVLVNYHGFLDTVECLESLSILDSEGCQVIIVDNSETDQDYINLQQWASGEKKITIASGFPQYVEPAMQKPLGYVAVSQEQLVSNQYANPYLFVKAKENKGFAAANNIALHYIARIAAASDSIWLLNNDTVVAPGIVDQIRKHVQNVSKEYEVSKTLFGTPLLEYSEPSKIQAIGGKYHKTFGITSHIGSGISVRDFSMIKDTKVDYPVGASMLFFSSFLNTVGMMNESYFLFYEELDWVQRARQLGGIAHILPILGVYHKQGKTTLSAERHKKSEFIDLLSLKNRILFSKRFYKKNLYTIKAFILTVTIFKRIISGNFDRVTKIIKLVLNT